MDVTEKNRIAASKGDGNAAPDGQRNVKTAPDRRRIAKTALIVMLILYPFLGAFFGLDLGDTGYHLFAFTNLTSNPDKINYTTFFTTVIGYVWNQLFGWMGLIGFNFLEVFLEWGMMAIIYRTFREELGEINVLFGCLLAVMASDTYLNVFNYHQFNVFMLIVILCLEYRAITRDKFMLSLWAGAAYTLLVFSRVGSVVAIVTLFLYVYDAVMTGSGWKKTAKHFLYAAAGAAAVGAVFLLMMVLSGTMDNFINNLFRLQGVASDSSTGYGFSHLLGMLVYHNLETIASGFIYLASMGVLACALNIGLRKYESRIKKALCVAASVVIGLIAAYQMQYAWDVNPAESWSQMTTGPRFVIGVMYVVAFVCFMLAAFRRDEKSRRLALIVLSAYLLVLLTIAGSNTGTKHVVLALWIIAPVCVYTVRRLYHSVHFTAWLTELFDHIHLGMHRWTVRGVLAITLVMFFAKFAHFLYYTFNYDSVNRLELTATVDNEKLRGILTTEREAEALEGVLTVVGQYAEDEDQPLHVFGNSLLFYYLTDRDSYVSAWVTSSTYSLEKYQSELEQAAADYGDTLPIVIYCRTDYSQGFDEASMEANQSVVWNDLYDGKKDTLVEFLEENGYGVAYANQYYVVYVPEEAEEFSEVEFFLYPPEG